MRRFRFVGDPSTYQKVNLVFGKSYHTDFKLNERFTVGDLAKDKDTKEDWQEVFEEEPTFNHQKPMITDAPVTFTPYPKPIHKDTDLGHFSLEIIKAVFQSPSVNQGPSKSVPEFVTDCIFIAKELIKQLNEEMK